MDFKQCCAHYIDDTLFFLSGCAGNKLGWHFLNGNHIVSYVCFHNYLSGQYE